MVSGAIVEAASELASVNQLPDGYLVVDLTPVRSFVIVWHARVKLRTRALCSTWQMPLPLTVVTTLRMDVSPGQEFISLKTDGRTGTLYIERAESTVVSTGQARGLERRRFTFFTASQTADVRSTASALSRFALILLS